MVNESIMSQVDAAKNIASELIKKLKGVNEELAIKEIALKYWDRLKKAIPNENSLRRARKSVRDAVRTVYPDILDTSQDKPVGYYFTDSKDSYPQKTPRFEHLVLWYLTTNTDRWEVVGDEAREKYFSKWDTEAKPQEQPQMKEPEIKQVEIKQPTLEDMTINTLELDSETQLIAEEAIKISGMSLADFVRQAVRVYAKTIAGKAKQYTSDLSSVLTTELLSDKYKTHPGRAEELTRRAIVALERHNDNCTEKSQKWMITQTSIQSLIGSKPATVKEILTKYQIRLDDHNIKHELNPYDNRKPGRKIENEIDISALVPDGNF